MRRKNKRKIRQDFRDNLILALDNLHSEEEIEAYIKNMFLLTGSIIVSIENKTVLKALIKEIK